MDLTTSALSRLEWRLKASFCSDPVLADFAEDAYFWSGQNIRGKICLNLGDAYGISEDILLDIAVTTQLLHDASLIHDDLIDEDTERRGYLTIWKKYGKAKAVLIGDLLISKAYQLVSNSNIASDIKLAWVNEISRAVSSAVFGAVSELQFDSHDKSLILENYYRMASRKTGALFALPARCIASASTREEDKDNLSEIFFKLAVAYQIKDDQCDFLGTKSGRQHSSDLKNGRPNLYHLLTNSAMSIEESFNYINDFHKSLVVDSIQLAETMPEKVRGIIKTLLIPFIEIKPLPSSNRLLPIGT